MKIDFCVNFNSFVFYSCINIYIMRSEEMIYVTKNVIYLKSNRFKWSYLYVCWANVFLIFPCQTSKEAVS